LGLRKDDVMLVQLPNTVEQFVVYVACSRLGLIATPVPAQYREHELQHVVHSTGAKAALTTQRIGQYEHAAMMLGLRASCPTLAHVLSYGEAVPALRWRWRRQCRPPRTAARPKPRPGAPP
ncbi:MAG: AMP-binding protein, partial [Comamonadaceae bacterium]|nr:AMP-binding protein [Comamonadaceae bacterium]